MSDREPTGTYHAHEATEQVRHEHYQPPDDPMPDLDDFAKHAIDLGYLDKAILLARIIGYSTARASDPNPTTWRNVVRDFIRLAQDLTPLDPSTYEYVERHQKTF